MKPTVGIAVDGSCLGNPGAGSYRAIDLSTGLVIFQSKVYEDCTNNIAEFLGIVHAIAYCSKHGLSLPIYSDSQTGRTWVAKRHCNSSHATSNAELASVVSRAECYLQAHEPPVIEVWRTREWNEIPSDFGYKGTR